jgi:hypothetical protein
LAALKAGDVDKAYSFTSRDFQNATSLADFQKFVDLYPAIKNNARTKFISKDVTGDNAKLTGTLISVDGISTPIEYLLIKEEGAWKILGIQVYPEGVTPEQTEVQPAVSSAAGPLQKKYDNSESRYSINYPASWEYEKAGQGTIIFSGRRGTPSYFSTVNIQTVLTKKTGGTFSTVQQFMKDLKKQAISQSPGIKFLESGPVSIADSDGKKMQGEYSTFTYKYKGELFKQWQVVVLRNDGQVFYAWAYTSPIEQYKTDLDISKQMLASWIIY